MEQYKEKLKLQNAVIAIACFILTVFSFLSAAGEAGMIPAFTPAVADTHWQSLWRGFIMGAACGILVFMIIGLVRNIRALRSEKELKKLYIKDNDERQIKIWHSARAASMQVFLILGLVAGVIAGYFNMTVSITILACVMVQAWIGLGFKLYYNRKF